MEGEAEHQADPLILRVRAIGDDLAGIEDDPRWLPSTSLAAAYLRERLDAWLRLQGIDEGDSVLGPLQGSDPPDLDVSAIAARESSRKAPRSINLLEVCRDALVFVPVGLTWWHLSEAFDGYSDYVTKANEAKEPVSPFLVAWQNGETGSTTFSTVAWQVVGSVVVVAVLSLVAAMRRRGVERKAQEAVAALCATFDEAQVVLAWIGADREAVASDVVRSATEVAGTMRSVDLRIGRAVDELAKATEVAAAANGTMEEDLKKLTNAATDLVDRSKNESQAVTSSKSAADSAAAAAASARAATTAISGLSELVREMLVDWRETRLAERTRMEEINAQVGSFAELLQTTEALQGRFATLHPDLYTCPQCSAPLADRHVHAPGDAEVDGR